MRLSRDDATTKVQRNKRNKAAVPAKSTCHIATIECSGRAALRFDGTLLHCQKDSAMPLINVKLIDGVFSPVQKKQIVERITDAMVSVEGEAMRPVTWVVIEEVKGGDWAIGGRMLTAADVHAMAGKKAA
jgi:4-oxalocrotonate tautomerase